MNSRRTIFLMAVIAIPMHIKVIANVLPEVSVIAKSMNEDDTLTFCSADFTNAYSDGTHNTITKVKITSLPAFGILKLHDVDIKVNDEIPISSIENLIFVPNANWNGGTSFGWNGWNGAAYATFDDNVNITVNPVNDPPTVSDVAKCMNNNNTVSLSLADFTGPYNDVDGDSLTKIMITRLPNGTLKLAGTEVHLNEEIAHADLAKLTFTSNAAWKGSTSFGWNGFDGKVYASSNGNVNIGASLSNFCRLSQLLPEKCCLHNDRH